jgi:hypothetical protein
MHGGQAANQLSPLAGGIGDHCSHMHCSRLLSAPNCTCLCQERSSKQHNVTPQWLGVKGLGQRFCCSVIRELLCCGHTAQKPPIPSGQSHDMVSGL